jgi:hypothetical protein
MRYRLRTLLIVLALAPPVVALAWKTSSTSLAVLGWLALIVFSLLVWKTDARQRRATQD